MYKHTLAGICWCNRTALDCNIINMTQRITGNENMLNYYLYALGQKKIDKNKNKKVRSGHHPKTN